MGVTCAPDQDGPFIAYLTPKVLLVIQRATRIFSFNAKLNKRVIKRKNVLSHTKTCYQTQKRAKGAFTNDVIILGGRGLGKYDE